MSNNPVANIWANRLAPAYPPTRLKGYAGMASSVGEEFPCFPMLLVLLIYIVYMRGMPSLTFGNQAIKSSLSRLHNQVD